jgi:hypothetical protein
MVILDRRISDVRITCSAQFKLGCEHELVVDLYNNLGQQSDECQRLKVLLVGVVTDLNPNDNQISLERVESGSRGAEYVRHRISLLNIFCLEKLYMRLTLNALIFPHLRTSLFPSNSSSVCGAPMSLYCSVVRQTT